MTNFQLLGELVSMSKLMHKNKIGPLTISDEYKEAVITEHRNNVSWGASADTTIGHVILGILSKHGYIQTVLDFGAGKGSLGRYIRERLDRKIAWTDYDPGMPSIDVLPEGTFDMVISSDVLEHVEPDKVEATIQLLADKTKTVLISDISCIYTGFTFGAGPFQGLDLHLSVHEPRWWREKFDAIDLQLFIYEDKLKLGKGKYKQRCFMVHERI